MKKSVIIVFGIMIVIVVSGFIMFKNSGSLQETSWKTVEIMRGNVENLISSTGSLNPVSTVEVGTQVSGTIVKVLVDFNDVVSKNQIIAEIDLQPLQIKLTQVQASYMRSEALFVQAKSLYDRDIMLHEKGLISGEEFSTTKTNYLAQKATLEGAKADVETARTNLSYATICSPVNGTVIKRNVDVGQTVAASLSAPILFIIAEDLQKMEILADVDESDIGKIKTDQDVTFSVPAYPDQSYKGKVSQIRLQPEIIQNVVTYTVVIKASNPDGTLLPGMTANVDFIAEKAENVFTVPSIALRFKPSDEIVARFMKERALRSEGKGAGMRQRETRDNIAGKGQGNNEIANGKRNFENRGTLWMLDDKNELHPQFVQIGISDGFVTEIKGRNITEGAKVVTGISEKKDKKKQSSWRSLFGPPRNTSGKNSMPPPPHGAF